MPTAAALPNDEEDRLAALHALGVLDTPPDPRLDRLTALTAEVFGAPIALASLVDRDGQRVKSAYGVDVTEVPRRAAFCAYTILDDVVLIVPDAAADRRFADSPLVLGPPFVRTYVGAPLISADGFRVGALCLFYDAVTPFDDAQAERLKTFAAVVSDGFELARRNRSLAEANAEIERQARLLEAVEDLVQVGGWSYNVATGAIASSKQVRAIKGFVGDDVRTLDKAVDGYPESARAQVRAAVEAAVEHAIPYSLELPLVTGSGKRLWVHTQGRPIVKDGQVTEIVGALQDITTRKKVERELDQRRREAEAANRAKSQFLAHVSHEIRTPLNAVMGLTTALLRSDLDEGQRDHVSLIRDAGETLLRLLDDFLDQAKIEAGRVEIESIPFSLPELLRFIEGVFAIKAAEKGLTFTVSCSEEAQRSFIGDPTRLRQVFSNLISNAIKFTETGRVDVDVAITSTGKAGVFDLCGAVSDTGPGIPADAHERLFSEYVQADASVTRRHGGTGLGLSISRSLCQLMGGDITLESQVGVGSTFRFTVRVVATEDAEVAVETPDLATAGAGLRVLVAEDNPNNRVVVSALLEPFAVELTFAENGREAVAIAEANAFDLILMDVQMPEMDGVEATRVIRRNEAARGAAPTPIVGLTANLMSYQLDAYTDAGMNACVGKPIRIAELVDVINALDLAGAGTPPGEHAASELR